MTTDSARLAQTIADLEKRLKDLERGSRSPQLGNSSLDLSTGRGYIPILENGKEKGRIGRQPDGSISTSFPNDERPPPKPNAPILEQTMGGVRVTVGTLQKLDNNPIYNFSRCNVYVDGLFNGVITTVPGSWIAAPLSQATHAFSVTSVNLSGVESEPTDFQYLQPGAAVASEVLDGAITTLKLADQAVNQAKLALEAVGTANLQGHAVTLAQLADGSVDARTLLDNAVTTPKVAPNAVTTDKITPESITAALILANTITGSRIAGDTITALQIAALTIGATELAANSVIAGKVAANTISTVELQALTIQASNIAADAIAAGKIAADAITGREIQALAITADKLAVNSVTAAAIQAGSISADKLAAEIVLATRIVVGDPLDWHLEFDGTSTTPLLYWNNEQTGFALTRDPDTGESSAFLSGRMEFGDGSQLGSDVIDLMQLPSTGFQQAKARQQRTWMQSALTTGITPQWTSPTMKGSLLVITVFQVGNGNTPNCGTPVGSTLIYSQVNGQTRLSTFIIQNVGGSRSFEHFDSSAGSCRWAITLSEYQGMQAAAYDVMSVNSSNGGSGTTASTGTTPATTFGQELQVAVFGAAGGNGVFNSPTNGFTKALSAGSDFGLGTGLFTKTATAINTTNTSVTIPVSSWIGMILTFRIAPAAGIPPAPQDNTVRFYTQKRSGKATPHVIDTNGYVYPFGRLPYCTVRSSSTFTVTGGTGSNPATNYIWAQGNWVAAEDPDNMVAVSTTAGVYSSITIPITGRYLINYRPIFAANASVGDNCGCAVGRNGRDYNYFLASDSRRFTRYNGDFHTPVQAMRLCSLLAGDVLYWGNWASITVDVLAGIGPINTEISVSMISAY